MLEDSEWSHFSADLKNSCAGGVMKRRIYILGGGFGGLYAALELERLLGRDPGVEITLPTGTISFSASMLHDVAASELELTTIVNPARKLFRKVHLFSRETRKFSSTH